MCRDPLVHEIRAIREAYAEQFGYDLQAIYRDLKKLERQSGQQTVSPPQPAAVNDGLPDQERTTAERATR